MHPVPDQDIDAIVGSWVRPQTPGCACAIIRDGEVALQRGYGLADLAHGLRITPDSVFYAASLSKQFTAAVVALLAQDGHLALTDDIRLYLPEWPDLGHVITIQHLIHHTSGLRDWRHLWYLAGWRDGDHATDDDLLALAGRQPRLNFPPGEDFAYSNTGYLLLARIVERARGQSLAEYAWRSLFLPIGMTQTRFQNDHTTVVERSATGYFPDDHGVFHVSLPWYDAVGAAGLVTTVADLAAWLQALATGAVGDSVLVEQLCTPGYLNDGTRLDYAYGLVVSADHGDRVIEHGGGEAGFRAHLLWRPEQHLAVAVLSNLRSLNPAAVAHHIAAAYLAVPAARGDGSAEPSQRHESSHILSAEHVRPFVGYYRDPDTDAVRRVYLEGDTLKLSLGPGLELEPLAEHRFRVRGAPVEIAFTIPDGSRLQLEEVVAVGKDRTYVAVPAARPTVDVLTEYAGTYESVDLETTYTIALQGDALLLERRRFAPLPLQPTTVDGFRIADSWTNPEMHLFFLRDEHTLITGFRLSTDRVRQVTFSRHVDKDATRTGAWTVPS